MSTINLLIARAGGKELSTCKLNELGCNAEKTAKAIYEKDVDALNAMDYAPSPDYDALLGGDVMNTSPTSSELASNVFWRSILPDNFHMLEIAPDENCLFRCILNQFNHDEGARHEFTRHQITNHISRNGDAFKDFLLLQEDHEDVSDLDRYLQKMGKNGAWGGHPEVHAAAWFYGVGITIYAKEYASNGGSLNFMADGPNAKCNTNCAIWILSYHGNNHYNSIRSPGNPHRPTQHITNVKRYQAYFQSALDDYHNDYAQLVSSSIVDNVPIPPHKVETI
jgi:hypothetical protein